MKKLLYIISITMFLIKPAQAKLFELSEYVLPNQLRLIVIPNHKAPIAKHMLWYKVGGADELPGKGGSAHLLEHLMFRGTDKIKGNDFNLIMQRNGADSNAFTSQNFTVYHQFVDISRLELAMFLEADRMKNLNIKAEDFATERDIVFQERKQVVDNNPFSSFSENLRRDLWQDHPYANPITGTETEIMNLKLEDVTEIYNKYYVPNNAILVISGDIEPQKAYDLALKYYGGIKAKEINNPIKFPELNSQTSTAVIMKLPRVQLPRLVQIYIAPSFATNKEMIYAYMVLSSYLGEGETSELYKDLVLDKKVAIGVSSSYNYAARSYGSFDIAAVPKDGVSLTELKKQLEAAMQKALENLSEQKIELIKKKMLSGLVYLKDNLNDAAYIVGMLASVGMSKEEIENYADKINAVTVSDVKKAADDLLYHQSVIEGMAEPIRSISNE